MILRWGVCDEGEGFEFKTLTPVRLSVNVLAWGLGFNVQSLISKYLEVHCTYNLLSNCSYNLNMNPISIVTLEIIGL